jgi:NAD-dependent DNA ligase
MSKTPKKLPSENHEPHDRVTETAQMSKPTDKEEEYFAKVQYEKRQAMVAEQRAKTEIEEQARLKELHWMRCPKCGEELVTVSLHAVEIDKCPCCDYPTEREGAYLVCPNGSLCSAQKVGTIRRWVEKLGIKHIGSKAIEAMTENGVNEISDLYAVVQNPKALGAMEVGGKKLGLSAAKKMKTNLDARMELTVSEFLGSMGIPLCGRSTCMTITEDNTVTLQELRESYDEDTLTAIDGMGEKRAKAFFKGFHAREKQIANLLAAGITIKKAVTGGALQGKTFCFTNFRDKQAEQALADQGAVIKSSVGKKLDYLVTSDPSATSGKTKKAREYGVTILSPDELRLLIA